MAFCRKCGTPLSDGVNFCPKCGIPVNQASDSAVAEAAEQIAPQENLPQAADFPLDEAPRWTPEPVEAAPEQQSPEFAQSVPPQQYVQPESTPQWQLDQQTPPAVPVKKKSKAKKAIIIAACAVLVLGIGGFIGKTYYARDLLKLFMGQNKYAQSLEEATAYGLTDKTVQTLDTVVQSLPTQGNNQAADFETTLHIDLDSKFSNQLTQQMGGNDTALKNLLAYVNALSFKGSSNVNNQEMQSTVQIAHNSTKLLSCNLFVDKSGKQYYQLPELSKTYLTASNSVNPFSFAVKYDSAKLNASLRAIAKVYVDAVPNAKTAVLENQSLTVEGVTVNAEKISTTFTTEQCMQMLKKMLETIKNDDYLYTVVSDNYNSLAKDSAKMDKAQYQKALDKAITELETTTTPSSGTLTVSAYVMPDGTQVAHSYEVSGMKGDVSKASLNLIFTKKNGLDQIAANVLADGKEYVTAAVLYNSSNSGTMRFSVKYPDQNMNIGLKVDFSGLSKTKFANRDIELGTFKFSISDPDDYLSNSLTRNAGAQSDLLKDVLKSTYAYTNSLDNNKLTSKVTLDITGIAKIAANTVTTPKSSSAISIPSVDKSNSIEVGSASVESESQQNLQAAYSSDAIKYFSTLLDKDTELAALFKSFGIDKNNLNRNSLDTDPDTFAQTY